MLNWLSSLKDIENNNLTVVCDDFSPRDNYCEGIIRKAAFGNMILLIQILVTTSLVKMLFVITLKSITTFGERTIVQ